MNKLVLANLIHRPMRSIISASAIAIEVVMMVSVAAIFLGQIDGQKIRTNGIGADMIVRPANSSFVAGLGGAPVPARNAEAFRKMPHVMIAAPAIQHTVVESSLEIIWGVDFESYNALRPFTFLQGTPFQGPNDVIVDDVFAESDNGHHVGETIKILNHPFRICGIVAAGKGGRKMIPIETLGQLIGSPNHASIFFLKADSQDNLETIRKEIQSTPGFEGYKVQTMREFLSLMTPENFPGFNIALDVVTTIAALVGFLVIFLSMYTAILERTREIGILKSMGASKLVIVTMVLRESIMMSLVGIGLGIGLTYVIHAVLNQKFPTMFFEITPLWLIKASIIAFTGAIIGASYPAFLAARKDPIDALSYE